MALSSVELGLPLCDRLIVHVVEVEVVDDREKVSGSSYSNAEGEKIVL